MSFCCFSWSSFLIWHSLQEEKFHWHLNFHSSFLIGRFENFNCSNDSLLIKASMWNNFQTYIFMLQDISFINYLSSRIPQSLYDWLTFNKLFSSILPQQFPHPQCEYMVYFRGVFRGPYHFTRRVLNFWFPIVRC